MAAVDGDARRARLGVSVVFGVCGAAFATWAARIPAAQQRLGLTPGQLAIALFGLAVGSVVALAGAGLLVTAVGSRASALIGSAVLCLGLPMVALANDRLLFTGALFVLGGGNSVLDVSMNAHAARVENEYGRPIFAGFHAFWNIGGIAGSGLAAILASLHVSIAVEFPATGGLLLAASWWAIGTRFLRGADRGQGGSAFRWPSRVLLPLGVMAFCGFITEGTVNDWSAVYLTNIAGAGPTLASLGYFVFSMAMIAVRLVADRLAARIGVARFIRAAALVAVAGLAVVVAITAPVVEIAGFGMVGLGVSAVVPLAWSAAGKRQPGSPGAAISAVATFGYLGFLLGPVMIGGLSGLVGLRLALISPAVLTGVICFLAPAIGAAAPARISRRPAPDPGTWPR